MVKFVMETGIEAVKVTEKNYDKFFKYFYDRIKMLCKPYARRFNLDASEVEEAFVNSILYAIQEWNRNKERITLTFEKWYWWVANQRVYNLANHEAKEREKRTLYHGHLKHIAKATDHEAILNALINSESMQKLIGATENYSEEFRELLEYMKAFLARNYSRAKIMSYTVKALSKKHAYSHERVYQTYRRMLAFLMDACRSPEGGPIVLSKSKKDFKLTKITCTMCGVTHYIKKKEVFKLIIQYGGLDELKYSYRCNRCNPTPNVQVVLDPDSIEKGDENIWSDTYSEAQCYSDSPSQ